MQAAVVNVLGQAPKYQSFPDPVAGEGEAVIQVRAAGLHPIVKALASGAHYAGGGEVPMVPGVDGVGTLEDGSRVYFTFPRKPWGSISEQTVAPRSRCIPVPEKLDDVQAAAIANPGMSAWVSMKERGKLVAGETVLVMGANGVAGQLALQVARQLGAKRVIAAARNVKTIAAGDADAFVELAAEEDAVYDAFASEGANGIDIVVDYLWSRPTELLLEALTKGFSTSSTRPTRLVEVGDSAGKTIVLPGATLRSIDLKLMGSGFGAVPMERVLECIRNMFKVAATGSLKVAAVPVPLAEVETAWNRAEPGQRIVFTV
jgi:NADPH:quinone reductase-like Zn-dependent oxidoreductase